MKRILVQITYKEDTEASEHSTRISILPPSQVPAWEAQQGALASRAL